MVGFRRLYNVRPERACCAPDVLLRFATIFHASPDGALSRRLSFEGIAVEGAVLPPGTVAFEGVVDEERMGDW